VITSTSGNVNGSNVSATKESGEPDHAGNAGGKSIWYRWQAPSNGSVTFSTLGSNFDTLLGIYTGSSVNALTEVASNDDDPGGGLTSRVTLNVVAGTQYQIAVDGYDAASGNVVLGWSMAAPIPTLQDSGFEATDPTTLVNPFWTSTSTQVGTSLCSLALCGTGGGSAGPRNGSFWAWFGGVNGPEVGTVSQTLTIPSGTATLNYYLRVGAVSAPFTDVLNVKVDGTVVQSLTEPSASEASYALRSVNLNAYANGGQHTISIEYVSPTGGGVANFNVDDVTLAVAPPPANSSASNSWLKDDAWASWLRRLGLTKLQGSGILRARPL